MVRIVSSTYETGHVSAVTKNESLRNFPQELDLDSVMSVQVNRSATERRCATLPGRRSVKKDAQAAWLLKAITMIDLTTLSGDDTAERVRRLCAKARFPLREDLLESLGMAHRNITTGAVCVYGSMVPIAVTALEGTGIPVAAVSTGFPAGLVPRDLKLKEIEIAVNEGASEIDIVIQRENALSGNWKALYDEIRDYRLACKDAHLKVILATGELKTFRNVTKASMVAMLAGADFIKTSTGKEAVNATLPVSLVMVRAIRHYHDLTGIKVGYKPAGGISTAKDVLNYMILVKEELGNEWLNPQLFRVGASSLITDIERQLEHHVTGAYSASHRHAMS